jgi:hypothetical protein
VAVVVLQCKVGLDKASPRAKVPDKAGKVDPKAKGTMVPTVSVVLVVLELELAVVLDHSKMRIISREDLKDILGIPKAGVMGVFTLTRRSSVIGSKSLS